MAKTININFAKHNKFFIFACFSITCIVCLFQSNYALSQTVFSPNTYKDSVFVLDNNNIQQDTSNSTKYKFVGSKSIRLKKGFKYKAKNKDKFLVEVDPLKISKCEYLTDEEIAALEAGNINTSLTVGATIGSANVSPSGAFSYSIPFFTPPGTNGLQPNISLVYDSQSGGGDAGWGWSLSGLSMINRTGDDIFRDGKVQQYSNDLTIDKLAIDGNRMILISPEGTWGKENAIYGTEIGNTMQIVQRSNPDGSVYFVAKGKDGETVEYGRTEDSRIIVYYYQSSKYKTCIVGWRINKIIDRFGNYIEFSYLKINEDKSKHESGESKIYSIKYTGHQNQLGAKDRDPYYEIKFTYSYKSDKNNKFLAINNTTENRGNSNLMTQLPEYTLLDSVLVNYIQDPSSPITIRSYQLKYTNSCEKYLYNPSDFNNYNYESSSYSQLIAIQEIGANKEDKFNPTVFSYKRRASLNSFMQYSVVNGDNNPVNLKFGDFNGDGITDVMRIKRLQHEGNDWKAYWNLEWGEYFECPSGTIDCGEHNFIEATTGINGTSKMFVTLDRSDERYYLYTDKSVAADFNSDGKDDLAIVRAEGWNDAGINTWGTIFIDFYIAKSDGTGFNSAPQSHIEFNARQEFTSGKVFFNPENFSLMPADYDGDGYLELGFSNLAQRYDNYGRRMLPLICFAYVNLYKKDGSLLNNPEFSLNKIEAWDRTTQYFPNSLDINQKADVIRIGRDKDKPNVIAFYYELKGDDDNFTASKFELKINHDGWDNTFLIDNVWNYDIGDLNGDGLSDIIYTKSDEGVFYRYNTGIGFTPERKLDIHKPGAYARTQFFVLDINGDGKCDILTLYSAERPAHGGRRFVRSITWGNYISLGYDCFDHQYFYSEASPETGLLSVINDIRAKYDNRLPLASMDFNGDGNTDIYSSGEHGGYLLTFNTNNNPLHLNSIIDGVGNKTVINYDIISNPHKNANEDDIVYEPLDDEILPLSVIKSNIYVVSSVEKYQYMPRNVNNHFSLLETYKYKYKHGLIHKYKGFLGFTDFITISYHETSAGLTRMEDRLHFELANNPSYTLNPKQKLTYANSRLVSQETYQYDRVFANDFKSSFYFPHITTSIDLLKNVKQVNTVNYDAWQNVTFNQTVYYNGEAYVGYKTSSSIYANLLGWCNSFVSKQTVSSNIQPNTGEYERQTHFYYCDSDNGFALRRVTNDSLLPNKVFTDYKYDEFGQITDSKTGQIAYDQTTLLDRETHFRYDQTGRFLVKRYSDAFVEENFQYYPESGALKYYTDINGHVTEHLYDSFLREYQLKTQVGQNTSGDNVNNITTNELKWYSVTNSLCPQEATFYKIIYSTNSPTSKLYCTSTGRELRTETEAFNTQEKVIVDNVYYLDGRLKSKTFPYFSVNGDPTSKTEYIYDGYLRLSVTKVFDLPTTTTYGTGTDSRSIEITDPYGKIVKKVYDALGNIVESSEVISPGVYNSVKFIYDNNLKLKASSTTAIDLPNEFVTSYEYDEYGNVNKFTDKDLGEFTYEYNPFGELVRERIKSEKDALGNLWLHYKYYEYDFLGRVKKEEVKKENEEGNNVTLIEKKEYNYVPQGTNGVGKIDNIEYFVNDFSIPVQIMDYNYDEYGRMISKNETIQNEEFTSSYFYDEYGRLQWQEYPTGVQTENEYDQLTGRLYKIKRRNGNVNEVLWEMVESNEDGVSTKYSMGNGFINTIKAYDSYKFPSSISTTSLDGTEIQNMSFEFDSDRGVLGRRVDFTNRQEEKFQYDSQNRLTVSIARNLITSAECTTNTDYFVDGSIKSKSGVESYQYKKYVNGVKELSQPYHAVKATTTFPVNQGLNLASEYNYNRMILSLEDKDDRADFTYGFDKSRLKVLFKKFDEFNQAWVDDYTKYYLDGCEKTVYLPQQSVTKEVTYINSPNGLIATIIKVNTEEITYYVHKDYLGSILALSEVSYLLPSTPQSVSVVAKFSYDAWGNPRFVSDWTNTEYPDFLAVNNFDILERGFTGHEHIRQFNIINMNARLYDSRIGRFFSPDKLVSNPEDPQSYNRYSYANNNPLIYTDPSGNEIFTVAFIIYTTVSFVSDCVNEWAVNKNGNGHINLARIIESHARSAFINILSNGLADAIIPVSGLPGSIERLLTTTANGLVSSYLSSIFSGGKYNLKSAVTSAGISVAAWGMEYNGYLNEVRKMNEAKERINAVFAVLRMPIIPGGRLPEDLTWPCMVELDYGKYSVEEMISMEAAYDKARLAFEEQFPNYSVKPGLEVRPGDGYLLAEQGDRGSEYYAGLSRYGENTLYIDDYVLKNGFTPEKFKYMGLKDINYRYTLLDVLSHETGHFISDYNSTLYRSFGSIGKEVFAIMITNRIRIKLGQPLERI